MEIDEYEPGCRRGSTSARSELAGRGRLLRRAVRLGRPRRSARGGRLPRGDGGRPRRRRHRRAAEPRPAGVGHLHRRRDADEARRPRCSPRAVRCSCRRWTCSTSGAWRCSPIRSARCSGCGRRASTRAPQLVNEPGTCSWSELLTTDVEASKAFYGEVFGWAAETHGDGPGAYTEWQVSGRSVGGMMQKPPKMPAEVPPFWAVYFAVADTDDAVEPGHRARRLGDHAADGHRARTLRRRRRSLRRRLQRHRAHRPCAPAPDAARRRREAAMARPRGAKARADDHVRAARAGVPRRRVRARARQRVPAPRGDDPLGADHRRERQQGDAGAVRQVPDARGSRRTRTPTTSSASCSRPASSARRRRACSAWRAGSRRTSTARCRPSSTTS